MINKTVGYILSLLAILLPIQGALILFITNKLNWNTNVSFWKEGLVIILSAIFIYQISLVLYRRHNRIEIKLFWPIFVYFGLCLLAVMDLIRIPLPLWVLGFRFELFWLGFFALTAVWIKLILKDFSPENKLWLETVLKYSIIVGFILSSIFSITSLVVGQQEFLSYFGYGQASIGFVSSAPNGHVIDYGNDSLRLSGPFSTPNHYAGYLILVLGFLLSMLARSKSLKNRIIFGGTVILNLVLIFLTYARFAWLSFFCIFAWLIWLGIKEYVQHKLESFGSRFLIQALRIKNYLILGFILILPIFIGLVVINTNLSEVKYLPQALVKSNSTELHRRHFLASSEVLFARPNNYLVGLGLGSSGPAAKIDYGHLNDSPIVKYYYPTAEKWFIDNADLVIPENWFLQVWLNGGIIYLFGYLSIFLIPIWSLWKSFASKETNWQNLYFQLSYFGIFIGCLFLHILENQTVAFMWSIIFIYWKLSVMINPESIIEEKPSL